MPTKKKFFTRNKKPIRQAQGEKIGNKSGKARGSIRLAQLAQDKKELKHELPSNSQSITERLGAIKGKISASWQAYVHSGFSWQKGTLTAFFVTLILVSLLQGFFLLQKGIVLKDIFLERMKLSQELQLWDNIAQKYPTYRDAYFQAAVLAYRLGDSSKEKGYLDKTLQLDPNYQPAQNLEKSL